MDSLLARLERTYKRKRNAMMFQRRVNEIKLDCRTLRVVNHMDLSNSVSDLHVDFFMLTAQEILLGNFRRSTVLR
jgi:hypothetical protein